MNKLNATIVLFRLSLIALNCSVFVLFNLLINWLIGDFGIKMEKFLSNKSIRDKIHLNGFVCSFDKERGDTIYYKCERCVFGLCLLVYYMVLFVLSEF